MKLVGRILGWGAGLLVVAVFAIYAIGPVDAFPGTVLGGTPTDAPTSWELLRFEGTQGFLLDLPVSGHSAGKALSTLVGTGWSVARVLANAADWGGPQRR